MKFRDFVRETMLRTVGLDGMRWVGEGLIVPSDNLSIDDWEASYSQSSCTNVDSNPKSEDRILTLR